MLLFYKSIDQSVLNAGLTIPVIYEEKVFKELGLFLRRGESKKITIFVGGKAYPAVLTNIQFDEKKYPNHRDLLQIRYGKNSEIAKELRGIFTYTYNLIAQNQILNGTKRLLGLSENQKEFIAIYSTPVAGKIMFECIKNAEFNEEASELSKLGEVMAESVLDGTDEKASILVKTKACKIRKLTRAISDNLKIVYGYRCQICGKFIGEPYGSHIIHAHHIDYFTRSLNNDAKNIMIVCPNHHAIIHDQNPIFDYNRKEFRYPNGFKEIIKLNFHL